MMFEVGVEYSIKMVAEEGVYSLSRMLIVGVDLPLIKVRHAGQEEIINSHSLHFVGATKIEADGDADEWSEFLPDYLKPGQPPLGR